MGLRLPLTQGRCRSVSSYTSAKADDWPVMHELPIRILGESGQTARVE